MGMRMKIFHGFGVDVYKVTYSYTAPRYEVTACDGNLVLVTDSPTGFLAALLGIRNE